MDSLTARIAGRRLRGDVEIAATADITLERERDNAADPLAVAVRADGELVGYLEAGLARLVAPLLDRGRPIAAGPTGHQNEINLFIPSRRERLGRNLVWVPSSDGTKSYLVDRRRGMCSCPAGRFVHCKHQRAVGATPRPRPPVAPKRDALASDVAAKAGAKDLVAA